jgi:hypothetical protein
MRNLARSQLFGSLNAVAAQTGQMPLIAAKFGPNNVVKAAQSMMSEKMDDLWEQSDFLVSNQFLGRNSNFTADKLKRVVEKGERLTATPMQMSAEMTAKLAWTSAYRQAVDGGLAGKKAIQEADRLAGDVMSNRVAGLRGAAYESRALQPVLAYTQDINQIWQQTKGMLGDKNYKGLATLLLGTYAFNQAYEFATGNALGADPIDAALDAGEILTTDKLLDDEGNPIGVGERLLRTGGRLAGEGAEMTPTGNLALGAAYPERGMQIPFSDDRTLSRTELFGDTQIGRFGPSAPIQGALERPVNLLGIPGTSQFLRSQSGLESYGEGQSVTPGGNVRFDVEQNPENFIRALLFGQYSTPEGQAYLEEQGRRLGGYALQ